LSLKCNILASYASQIYVTLVGILLLPLYIKYMGAEAYGLVGFFTMLQAWFTLLDLGLTPTIGRETARYRGGAMSALAYRQLFRVLSLLFAGIAVIGGGGLWLISEVVATRWLNVSQLLISEVVLAVQIMAVSVALRWMGGLYRGVITGSERLIWLGGFNAVIASLRFIAVFASMWVYGFTPFVFFIHQLIVAVLELFGLHMMCYRLLPARACLGQAIGWSFRPVQPLLKFALTIAFTSSVWVLVTQTDKLVLSGILPLAEYGHFTLAVLVASGITVITGPISTVIMPRMAKLHAEGQHDEMIKLYRNATQLVSIIGGAAAITLAICAEPLLFAWTGDKELAIQAAPVLRLYAIGNGFLAIAAFSYYLQYAKGNLRYHLIGNSALVFILIPSIISAAVYYGSEGAGYAWLIINGLFLSCWVAFVHYKIEPGLHCSWMFRDVLLIISTPVTIAFLLPIEYSINGRWQSLEYMVLVGGGFFLVSLIGSSLVRQRVVSLFAA
jgi:O-antigen/teichoic acid export membrane protein